MVDANPVGDESLHFSGMMAPPTMAVIQQAGAFTRQRAQAFNAQCEDCSGT